MSHTQPVIVVSKCLGFAHCRYNGQSVADSFVDSLGAHVEFHTVCPECEIGLGIPRDPIRLVRPKVEEAIRLMQSSTGRDLTDDMQGFVDSFLNSLGGVDGFILKYRSPTCGFYNVKLYADTGKSGPIGKTGGLFGLAVRQRFPDTPAEDEGRLHNFTIREHFLTRIFALADLRHIHSDNQIGDLVAFHARNKLLLMAYDQDEMRACGRICANTDGASPEEVFAAYDKTFRHALRNPPKFTNAINTLQHGFGYVSDQLEADEKSFFLQTLEDYRHARVPLSVPLRMLYAWILRYEVSYLKQQTFFQPYPLELVEITDSGKGRSLR